MIPKSGYRFSERSCATNKLERDADSKKRHLALRVHLNHDALREDLLDLGVAMGDALLVGVAQELLEGRAILLDPERERIAVEHVAHAACVGGEPGQRVARDRLLEHAFERAVLGFVE